MKGVYLAAHTARHKNYNIDYNDIEPIEGINIVCDMLKVDINKYDYIIATPPCNYYSRCNYRRETSKYSQLTKHLLPSIIDKLCKQDKPFIIENVRNSKLFQKLGLYDKNCFIYIIGRHTYWTNILLPTDIPQRQDFKNGGYVIKYNDMKNCDHQGGYNVSQVINLFLQIIAADDYESRTND